MSLEPPLPAASACCASSLARAPLSAALALAVAGPAAAAPKEPKDAAKGHLELSVNGEVETLPPGQAIKRALAAREDLPGTVTVTVGGACAETGRGAAGRSAIHGAAIRSTAAQAAEPRGGPPPVRHVAVS